MEIPYLHGHADLSFQFWGSLMGAGYYDGRVLTNRWYLSVQFLCQGLQDVNFQVDGLASGKAYAIGQGLW